ncbi:conserved hypothetical protein [Leishmania braziliensis MHOM/BR/75/M2904]|uniref:Serine/threonine-protein phosphatase 4 regulatory subunit 4 n=2 Tax=Leishmania braziliensis TaxID=5660 RepID=A4HD76_LEIBR|nr:conserved hypothetical protein [Leishmania braziliensis MHOM/BR/75/M2904]CAJ2473512.1 unnamed protein product [Leishmania braziliensis]CAM42193.1 conserved hypothetical protein [Leishmania braziliensis MHOM/BR/75/M2904]SYZ66185.1 hypothetical_protein [Leishmania braziliensis MHOM/BR/75/M2904]
MDYRSPFELRQQLLEGVRAAQTTLPPKKTKYKAKGGYGDNCATPLPTQYSAGKDSSGFMPFTALPDDPTALVREVPGAENIEALNAALEREEAVQRYVEKEKLSVEESAKYIMANGSTGQRISYFAHIREQLVELPSKAISKVLETLLDSMWTQDPELQCRAPENLLKLVGLLDSDTATELYDVTKTMLTVQMPEIRVAWCELLLGLIDYLPVSVLQSDLIILTVNKSEHAQSQDQRELSCKLLGALCQHMVADKVEELILPRALALCQDTNVGVRQRMCQQLCAIAHSLGVEKAKIRVAPDLFELLTDEEQVVSRAAFSCLIDLVEFFGSVYRREKLFPIIKNFISNPPSEVFGLLVGEFGRFLDAIKTDIVSEDDVTLFANFFCTAATRHEEDARRHCAFNFPAVVASLPRSVFATHLSKALLSLSADSCVAARLSTASGMHELLPLLHTPAADLLERPFLRLIADPDASVRAALVQHISNLLDYFRSELKNSDLLSFFSAVLDSLLAWVSEPVVNWRTMQHVMQIVDHYVDLFEERTLTEQVVPRLWEYAKTGATILKADCATLIMHIASRIVNPITKAQIFSRLNSEYGRSTSCYARQTYIYFVSVTFRFFSLRCVRERMLECCLELQRDSVTAVRLALARSLPLLSQTLRKSNAGALEDEFTAMIGRLCEDVDEEVREEAAKYAVGCKRRAGEDTAALRRPHGNEEEDGRREKAELAMLEHAKETDKAERRAKLRDLLKSEREKELVELPSPLKGRKPVPPASTAPPPLTRRHGSKHFILPPVNSVSLPRIAPTKQTPARSTSRRRP